MTSQLRTALSAADRFFLNLIPLLGLVCVFFSRHLTKILPLLMGSAMLIVGGLRLWHSLRDKEYLTLETNRAAGAVVLFVMGVVFLRAKGDALGLMGTTWGLIGLTKSVEEINLVLYQLAHQEKFLLRALKAGVTLLLAIILLFDPFESFSHHVIILGFELVITSVKLKRHMAKTANQEIPPAV